MPQEKGFELPDLVPGRTTILKGRRLDPRWAFASVMVLALYTGGQGIAEVPVVTDVAGCTLIDGELPPGCVHSNAGSLVTMPAGANTEGDVAAPLGDEGFAIIIDAPGAGGKQRVIAGAPVRVSNSLRAVDQSLAAAGVSVTFDNLAPRTRLAISTQDMRRSYAAGDTVTFRASSNYPAYIAKSEIRVFDRRDPGRVVAVIPVSPNGKAAWTLPADGSGELAYALRVYDSVGRYDETIALPISRSAKRHAGPELDGPIIAAGEGEDMTRRRAIPVNGGAVTISADNVPAGSTVVVMGEAVPVDQGGAFVTQRILPVGMQQVRVGVGGRQFDRQVEIPRDDWFYFGMVDLTVGEANGDSYTLGRVAGYAKGTMANGVTVTAAVDTREGELDNLFNDFGAKEPSSVLRRIQGDDVYPTFGDDSSIVEEAPTSGKLYLKVQKDNSYFLWGDFKTTEEGTRLVRSDRTLYGLQAVHESRGQTAHGEPRLRISAYAAQPDRLAQRDVLRGTGGMTYFLQRQDILTGTATLYVQWRDPVTGLVVKQDRLVEGQDYEINYFQGVVLLSRPLNPAASGGLISDRPMGDYDIDLVAQYEYVPTVGNVDGMSAGARVEGWVNDNLRIGATAQRETSGIAENELFGVDMLWRHSDKTYFSAEFAQSKGPGFGFDSSLNGGLDFDPTVSAGAAGLRADSLRLEARAELEEITNGRAKGYVLAYYDRKEKGFVSSDYDIDATQEAIGLDGKLAIGPHTELTFGYEKLKKGAGERREDGRIGISHALNDQWTLEAEVAHTDRMNPSAAAALNGSRTDAALRLTYERDEDFAAWVFAQTTLSRSGGLPQNDRLGFGAKARLSEKFVVEGEISDGSLGRAGFANLIYEPNASSNLHLGYRLDPMRRFEGTGFTGEDGGVWVVGAESRLNDRVTLRAESTLDHKGNSPSLTSSYGVTYTPSEMWTIDGNIVYGETDDPVSGNLSRRGLALGVRYAEGDRVQAGIKGEIRRESSSTDASRDRTTWGLSAYGRFQLNESTRLVANVDALVSESDQSSLRDGKFVEANIGIAYRPVDNDRLNILARYTYLMDLPGPDQVNFEGDLNGPLQKSHILSIDVNYDISQEFTIGGKIGYRRSEVADRGSSTFTKSTATFGVIRVDYHMIHNWDVTAEGRIMKFHETGVTEKGAVLGIWRNFGNNVKAGVGYQWGNVSSDLREIQGRKEGAFFNIVATF